MKRGDTIIKPASQTALISEPIRVPNLIVGIDCGVSGAIAVIDTVSGQAQVFDIPTDTGKVGGKNRTMYVPDTMAEALLTIAGGEFRNIKLVVIEHQQVMGKEGVVSACTIGLGYGLWLGICAALKLPREIVKPADWKRAMLQGRDKEMARAKAIELFPQLTSRLLLKKHHGRAEALLLVEYGRRLYPRI
jgi:crossover junction endodeoxyribonuclease RuvC